MFVYEVWLEGSEGPWCKHQEIAESPGKAKYEYYLYLQDGIYEAPFGEIVKLMHCHKVGIANVSNLFGNQEQFERVCQIRGITFAYQGMRIEVDGKPGTIVGANHSCNLDVVFDGKWFANNCHPWWKTRYFDKDGTLIKEFAG